MDLLYHLRHRGHAATGGICAEPSKNIKKWTPDTLPPLLKKARGKPQWSSLNEGKMAIVSQKQAHTLRDEAAWQLSAQLQG